MDLAFSDEDRAFLREVRGFTAQFRAVGTVSPPEDALLARWKQALVARGWQAYKWPREFGGTGWSPTRKYLWERECGAVALPPDIGGMGIGMIGPILCGFGTDAQRARYLPGILEGTTWWCQGYSEPGAGSDLAGLRTQAVLEGDHYRVNGEKLWTSDAHKADRMFCLTRTDSSGRKQEGITFLLLDMRDPGIEIVPIRSIDGRHSLNRVVLTDVRVPVEDRIGEEGRGWIYAKGLLTHERTGLAFVAESRRKLAVIRRALAEQAPFAPLGDSAFARKLDAIETALTALETTELRTLAETAEGQAPGAQSSILKLEGTRIVQRLTELAAEASGWLALPYPLVGNELAEARIGPRWCQDEMQQYLIARSASIAGGADEVQRNIIAKHVLGL
ncbi:MAG: acyl-CoA dehydrogenase family protein [Pseudomonadales bacterium]|jgi:alkylation response protein AidB-like acyl-CoA dehydrogenase|nr:acyl-CoA dehydrogenase family protein [Pseudomonadales bacterium]